MSCVRKQIVLRIPAEAVGVVGREAYDRFDREHPGLLDYQVNHLSYSLSSTGDRLYFDYILSDEEVPGGCALDFYAKSRALKPREKSRYLPVFRRLHPDVDMDKVRRCEYVWYDSTESQDCYWPDESE